MSVASVTRVLSFFLTVLYFACILATKGDAGVVPILPSSMPAPKMSLMLETGGHTALIRNVEFTADERYLVSAGEDKTVRIWDLRNGSLVRALRGQVGPGFQGSLNALAVSPDGKLIATGGYSGHEAEGECEFCGDIRLFDFASGAVAAILNGQSQSVASLAFSSDGSLLVSGHTNAAIIWDTSRRSALHSLPHDAAVKAARFLPNETQVVTGDTKGVIRLWNVSDGSLVAERKAHDGGGRRDRDFPK